MHQNMEVLAKVTVNKNFEELVSQISELKRCIGHYLKENPLAAEASDSASLPVDNSVTHHQMLEDQNAVNRKCDGIFLKLLELKESIRILMEVMENKEPSISPFSSAAGLTQILEDLINSPQQQQDLQEADYNGAKVEDISDKNFAENPQVVFIGVSTTRQPAASEEEYGAAASSLPKHQHVPFFRPQQQDLQQDIINKAQAEDIDQQNFSEDPQVVFIGVSTTRQPASEQEYGATASSSPKHQQHIGPQFSQSSGAKAKKGLKCTFCGKTLKNLENLKLHEERHQNMEECVYCQRRYLDLKYLRTHYTTRHPDHPIPDEQLTKFPRFPQQ